MPAGAAPRAANRSASGNAYCSPEKPATKAAATDFAARFQPAIDAQQITPRRQPVGLAREQAPEHHAVAAQQRARDVFDRRSTLACGSRCYPVANGGSAPSGRHLPCRSRCVRRRLVPPVNGLRRSDGTSSARNPPKLSDVTRPRVHQLAERFFHLRTQQAGGLGQFLEERRALRLRGSRAPPALAYSVAAVRRPCQRSPERRVTPRPAA